MSILSVIIGGLSKFFIGDISSLGLSNIAINAINELAKTEGEKIDRQKLLDKLNVDLQIKEMELTQSFISNKSFFMIGWWGLLAWSCSLALIYSFFMEPILSNIFGISLPSIDSDNALNMIYILLGMGTLKTSKGIMDSIVNLLLKRKG